MNSFNRSPKKWLSFEDQLDLLVERGLIIKNKKFALPYLESIGYYRLSGYWYPFKEKIATGKLLNKFISNSYFQDILDLYIFDKRLRLLALDALERIEIAIRVDISYLLGEKESLAHTNSAKFDKSFQHEKWLSRYEELLNQSKKLEFIDHHNQYYGGRLPICPRSTWGKRFIELIEEFPRPANKAISLNQFGLIKDIDLKSWELWSEK